MALPKHLRTIDQRLSRIEEKLGITEDAAPRTVEPQAESPEQVAARIDYESYSAKEIIERAESLTAEERKALSQYERANENRVTVIRALEG